MDLEGNDEIEIADLKDEDLEVNLKNGDKVKMM